MKTGCIRVCRRSGFTLMELMLAIGMLGIISTAVIVAINPANQLDDAQNAKRTSYIREQEKAVVMYMINEGQLPADNIPAGTRDAALPICRVAIINPLCVNLDVLIPEYLVDLPMDIAEEEANFTGYRIYQDNGQRLQICNDFLPAGDANACAGNASSSAGSSSSTSVICCSSVVSSSSDVSSVSTSIPTTSSSVMTSSTSTSIGFGYGYGYGGF